MLRLVCLVLALSLVTGLELKSQLKDHWKSFKAAHNKDYEAGEEQERKQIFKNNVEKVLKHNLEADVGEKTHQLGINKFADMSHEEFKQKYLGLRIDLENQTESRNNYVPVDYRATTPKTVDWRTEGYISPVKDQGECGSCWTFATTGALEGHHFLATGQKVVLSEQQLVDCSKNGNNNGCDGGLPNNAFKHLIENGGAMRDSCYPYEGIDSYCRFKRSCVVATMRDFVRVKYGDEFALKQAVAKGPVAVGIDAEQDDLQLYKNGVYKSIYCTKNLNHAVLVVGYGEEDGLDYWLVKNSWGTSWGINGYFKLARNYGNKCGIASLASYPVV